MTASIVLGLLALFLGAVVWQRIKTGSIMASPQPGMGSGKTTREKHPIFFWLWNIQLIGTTLMLSAAAIISFLDSTGILEFPGIP